MSPRAAAASRARKSCPVCRGGSAISTRAVTTGPERFGLDPAQAGQEREHGPVLGEDLRGEVIDPDLEGALTQAGEQRGAKPAPLPLVNHRHPRISGIGLVRAADEPALPHDLRGQQRHGDQRLVIVWSTSTAAVRVASGSSGMTVKKRR